MNITSYKENVQFLEDEKRKADIAELQKNVTGMRKSIKIISEILYSISIFSTTPRTGIFMSSAM